MYEDDDPELQDDAEQDTTDWRAEAESYRSRFEQYRSEADRRATEYQQTQQLLDDLQSDDFEAQRAAAERLGLEFANDPGPDPGPEPDKLSAIEQKLAAIEAREQAAAEREEQQRVLHTVNEKLAKMGLPADSDDGDWVLARAINLGQDEQGLPLLDKAYEQLQARDKAKFEQWRASKRTPAITPGAAASEQKNILDMTDEERIDWVLERHSDM